MHFIVVLLKGLTWRRLKGRGDAYLFPAFQKGIGQKQRWMMIVDPVRFLIFLGVVAAGRAVSLIVSVVKRAQKNNWPDWYCGVAGVAIGFLVLAGVLFTGWHLEPRNASEIMRDCAPGGTAVFL